jgi:hypothetical protein
MKWTVTTLISVAILLAANAMAQPTTNKGSDKKSAVTDTTAKQSRQGKEKGAEYGEKTRQHATDKAARTEKSPLKDKSAKDKGKQTANEMQARRDERKEIQKEYRESADGSRPTGKKPWWKFWASDDV